MLSEQEGKLLGDWEDVFKQGLLVFWVLTALQDAKLSVAEIGKEVAQLTKDTYTPAEQTLYRLLRKQYSLDLVNFSETPGNGGPMRKLYGLTDLGEKMLTEFTKRNIELFHTEKVQNILKEN